MIGRTISRYRITERLGSGGTGQPVEKIEKDVERDFIITAEQAKAYGVVDEIITKHR